MQAASDSCLVGRLFVGRGCAAGKLWIGRTDNLEGGDFPEDEVRAVLAHPEQQMALAAYYVERF